MVDVSKNLPNMFWKRFMDGHFVYLNSIADIMINRYHSKVDDWSGTCSNMVEELMSAGRLPQRKDPKNETQYFRNLRNCWYHECALHHPLDDIDERMRFAAWKIIQCYYAMFCAISAVVRLNDDESKGHERMLNTYLSNFVCSHRLKKFCLPPLSFYLTQARIFSDEYSSVLNWSYGNKHHLPNVQKCLEYTQEKLKTRRKGEYIYSRTGIPHYLRLLRDWTNYKDAYLFFRLYGPKIKENLDRYLKTITFGYCVQTEFFLLRTFGLKTLELQYDMFSSELETNLHTRSPALDERFKIYYENSACF